MKYLHNMAGALMLLLLALYNSGAYAQQTEPGVVPYEILYGSTTVPVENNAIVFESQEVVQDLPAEPDCSRVWLDGRVSFVGGELSTSKCQFEYAEANRIPVITSSNINRYIAEGVLVRLEGPHLRIRWSRVVPYVRPETRDFLLQLSEDFAATGCGPIYINSALRVLDGPMPEGASDYSVHPHGMAADIRVNNLNERCHQTLWDLLHESEARLEVDATREWVRPHFHVVVIPKVETAPVYDLVARYPREKKPDNGQDE